MRGLTDERKKNAWFKRRKGKKMCALKNEGKICARQD